MITDEGNGDNSKWETRERGEKGERRMEVTRRGRSRRLRLGLLQYCIRYIYLGMLFLSGTYVGIKLFLKSLRLY